MGERKDKAIELHSNRYTCSQAVACAFCDLVDIDETTMKEELMCLFYPESQRYDLDEIKALKNEKNSLETLYQGWMDSDLNINQLLEDNTDEIIAELAEEYKAKQSKKKAKER